MTPDQLRRAFGKMNGERNVQFVFAGNEETLHIAGAMLVPEEGDHLVKLTDGRKEFIIDAERIIWVEIG